MSRWIAAGLLATVLGCGDDPPCEVEALVADALGGPAEHDCAEAGGRVFEVFFSRGEGGRRATRHECAALELNAVFTCESALLRSDLCLLCTDRSSDTTLCREG